MTYWIDAHLDLAYNALSFGRDYLLSAAEIRQREADSLTPGRTGQSMLGWPDFQRGQVALVFGTLFLSPRRRRLEDWEILAYSNAGEFVRLHRSQVDYYMRLAGDHPAQFRLVRNRQDLAAVLAPWQQAPAELPEHSHPMGILLSMEGAEGLGRPEDLEEYWELGLRAVGPVWAGGRFCGGTLEPGGFTREGYQLLEVMAGLGLILDLAHMTEQSVLQALDAYPGTVIASHANARALLMNTTRERHFTDTAIRRLAERGGVMGVVPYNHFLRSEWTDQEDRALVTLDTLAEHIDHVCQLTGSAAHVAIGTDFDGGFGYPAVPLEMNSVADLPKLATTLRRRGYVDEAIHAISHGNWQRILETTLP